MFRLLTGVEVIAQILGIVFLVHTKRLSCYGGSSKGICPVGIFEDGPAHTDEVGTALLQKGLGLGWSGNPSCEKDGEVNRLLDRDRQVPEIPGFPVSGTDKAVHAAGEVEQIYAAVLRQSTGLHTVLNRASPGRIVTATQPQGNVPFIRPQAPAPRKLNWKWTVE